MNEGATSSVAKSDLSNDAGSRHPRTLDNLASFIDSWLPLTSLQNELLTLVQIKDEGTLLKSQLQFEKKVKHECRRILGNAFQTYLNLSIAIQEVSLENGIEIGDRINSLAFKHDLSLTMPPETALRTRCALQYLTQFVRGLDQDVHIIDLGCGNGQLSLGVLQWCPNVRSLIAIDNNAEAIKAFARCLERIPPEIRTHISDKVVIREGSYMRRNMIESSISRSKGELTILLSAFPMHTPAALVDYLGRHFSSTTVSVQLYPDEGVCGMPSDGQGLKQEYAELLAKEKDIVQTHQISGSYLPDSRVLLTVLGRKGE